MKLVIKLYRALVLALVVLWELVISSIQVARAILARSPRHTPALIELPLTAGQESGAAPASSPAGQSSGMSSHMRERTSAPMGERMSNGTSERMSDGAIALLAHLITLTPGTLSVDVSDDRRVLYVHALFARDPDALRRALDQGLKRRVMELWQ